MCSALFMSVFPVASANAQALRCEYSKPSLSVKISTTGTKYIRTKSAQDLTQIHSGSGQTVGGLGGGEIGLRANSQFEISSLGDSACVKLRRIEVTFYAKPEIHIASNFGRNSCEYGAVLAHEQGHIRILRKFVREYSPKVRQEMRNITRRLDTAVGPIKTSQIKTAQSKLQSEFLAQLERYNDKILPVLSNRQQAHDTPEEYARVSAKCRKWEEKLQ